MKSKSRKSIKKRVEKYLQKYPQYTSTSNFIEYVIRQNVEKNAMIKPKLASFPSKINQKTLAKALQSFDKGMTSFNKGVKEFGEMMDQITKELSNDAERSNQNAKVESKKNQRNVEKLFGKKKSNVKIWSSSKSNVKIWSDKKTKENLF